MTGGQNQGCTLGGCNRIPGEENGDVITISESLAKSHFPELLETPQEVYEISNTEGASIELLMDSVFHRNGLLKFEQRIFFFHVDF